MSAVAPPIVEPLAAAAGWPPVFVLAAASAALGAALSQTIREDRLPRCGVPADCGSTLWAIVKRRRTIHYAAIIAATGSAFGVMFTYQQPFVMGLGRADVGNFFVAYSTMAILVRVVFGGLPDRLGRFRVAVFA